MTDTSKEEQRALSQDELELVSEARQPRLAEMSDRELSDLVTRLRDRRDRARQTAERQRREMRGKAAPAGATAARDDTGTRSKEHFLGAALGRAQEERDRRAGGDPSQAELSRKALEMRESSDGEEVNRPENPPTPDEGMHPAPNEEAAPSGALDAEGYRPVLERSRKVR